MKMDGETRLPPRSIQPVVKIMSLSSRSSDLDEWRQKSPQERWAAVEQIRMEFHGWKPDARPRLQRVYRIVKAEVIASRRAARRQPAVAHLNRQLNFDDGRHGELTLRRSPRRLLK
jgi:hypothetical protein